MTTPPFDLTESDRATLLGWAAQPDGPVGLRSRIVLALADGLSNKEVAARLEVSAATVGKWRARFVEQGVDGLADAPRSGRPRSVEREEAERLISVALNEAERGGTVPSTHALARSLGMSQSTVARIYRDLQEAGPLEVADTAAPPADLLPRELLSDRVYEMLRRWIVERRLTPGQRLSESEVARRLGTSQAPAREAIKR